LTKPVKSSQLYNVLMGIFAGQCMWVSEPKAQPQFDTAIALRHPLRILLAEDNVVNQKVALRILERMGYRADVAANGLEVLEALERQHYDVVLMDVQMPEMDGVETTQRIREQWMDGERPWIVAMTAHALSGDRERCLGVGMDDYISKPVRVEELMAALERCRSEGEGADDSAVASPTEPQSTAAAIDPEVLTGFREMMGEATEELIGLYVEDGMKLLAELREGLTAGDAVVVRRTAHTLKGSSATVGAMGLSGLCREVEMMADKGVLDGVVEKVTRIESEYEKVRVALEVG
jgi:CheY-like chemotaxis protein/HPt (histidine-containing phosphotransfer) domain-containing protein